MVVNPDKKGNIKDVVDAHQHNIDRFENYIDHCILHSAIRPVKITIEYDVPDNSVIRELRAKYLSAGWKNFECQYSADSRGDCYCDIELS